MSKHGILIAAAMLCAALPVHAATIWYDGQTAGGTYVNTTYDAAGLTYTMANGQTLRVTGGKRTTPGNGDPGGNDYFGLNPTAGDVWDTAGLYDTGTGTIGGGNVSGTLYLSVLVRAHGAASSTTENKDGIAPDGAYAAFQLSGGPSSLGLGNYWEAWAYSVFGVTGSHDLRQASGGTTYLSVNTAVHMLVAKITFNAGAADDIAIWLDPNPDHGAAQGDLIRRYIADAVGDISFNTIAYRSGNIPTINSWDFDEVRFGTTLSSVMPVPAPTALPAGLVLMTMLGLRRRR